MLASLVPHSDHYRHLMSLSAREPIAAIPGLSSGTWRHLQGPQGGRRIPRALQHPRPRRLLRGLEPRSSRDAEALSVRTIPPDGQSGGAAGCAIRGRRVRHGKGPTPADPGVPGDEWAFRRRVVGSVGARRVGGSNVGGARRRARPVLGGRPSCNRCSLQVIDKEGRPEMAPLPGAAARVTPATHTPNNGTGHRPRRGAPAVVPRPRDHRPRAGKCQAALRRGGGVLVFNAGRRVRLRPAKHDQQAPARSDYQPRFPPANTERAGKGHKPCQCTQGPSTRERPRAAPRGDVGAGARTTRTARRNPPLPVVPRAVKLRRPRRGSNRYYRAWRLAGGRLPGRLAVQPQRGSKCSVDFRRVDLRHRVDDSRPTLNLLPGRPRPNGASRLGSFGVNRHRGPSSRAAGPVEFPSPGRSTSRSSPLVGPVRARADGRPGRAGRR